MSNGMFLHPGENFKMQEPAEKKRTHRNHRLQPGRDGQPADLLLLTLTILIQGQQSDAEIRAAVWGRSLFDNGAALVGVAGQPSCPRGQLGQVTLDTDTTVAPYIERRHDMLTREPLR